MNKNWPRVIAEVLAAEGGYSNDPHDSGGETNYGISKRAYPDIDIKHITKADAEEIYHRDYWIKVHGDDLPSGVDLCAMDFAVNSGVRRAILGLQVSLGVQADGILGPVTLAATETNPVRLIHTLCGYRLAFLHGLDGWARFGKGWTSRVDHVQIAAIAMATKAAT